MYDDVYLDDLERYLQHATILDVRDPALSGAHGQKRLLLLEGGIPALAKPEAGIADGGRAIIREVAAWLFSRELNIANMVACTVMRDDVPLAQGGIGRASVQAVWHGPFIPDLPGPFPETDKRKAAMFDTVIAHSDRGHNWLAVPDNTGEYRLKLIDHGYSFGFQGGLNSTFAQEFRGAPLNTDERRGLERCCAGRHDRQLEQLFAGELAELESAFRRAAEMLARGNL